MSFVLLPKLHTEHRANSKCGVLLQQISEHPRFFYCMFTNVRAFFKVIVVESGEAIRLGDGRADSTRNESSLRIRTGRMFGAEEVRA